MLTDRQIFENRLQDVLIKQTCLCSSEVGPFTQRYLFQVIKGHSQIENSILNVNPTSIS